MTVAVTPVWEDLEREGKQRPLPAVRLYRALGSSAIGIRAGYLPHQNILELLIEVPQGWSGDSVIPNWRGMGHEVVALGLPPRKEAHHLRLFIEKPEHREVFLTLCEDLVIALEGLTDLASRVKEIETSLLRWRRFFEKSGPEGLPTEMQQGLFAELVWLQKLLEANVDQMRAVVSWKGCERGYHDFDFNCHVVEVKSTRTKEPRKITINNERQLDNRGLKSLHLYSLSLNIVENGGLTLPECVENLRLTFGEAPAVLADFNNRLVSAGYLDRDAENYTRNYVILAENFYKVLEGFPRLIDLPPGVGDLRYKVLLAACEPYRTDFDDFLQSLWDL